MQFGLSSKNYFIRKTLQIILAQKYLTNPYYSEYHNNKNILQNFIFTPNYQHGHYYIFVVKVALCRWCYGKVPKLEYYFTI